MHNSRIVLGILLLGMLLMASVNIGFAFLQSSATVVSAPTSVPILLWIPFVLGFIAHWAKKYFEDKVANSFFNYFLTGVLATISTVIGGFSTFIGMYLANPLGYPENLAGYLGVFLISFAWDSLANGPGSAAVIKTTGA